MAHPKRPTAEMLQSYVGTTLGDWTVVAHLGLLPWKGGPRRYNLFLCRCACGYEKPMRLGDLRARSSQACRLCTNRRKFWRHGEATPVPRRRADGGGHKYVRRKRYGLYMSMLGNARTRHLSVDPRWTGPDGYRTFVADLNVPERARLSLRCRDRTLGYTPDNCFLVPRPRVKLYYHEGSYWTLPQLAWSYNMHPATLAGRLRRGLDLEKALRCAVEHRPRPKRSEHAP